MLSNHFLSCILASICKSFPECDDYRVFDGKGYFMSEYIGDISARMGEPDERGVASLHITFTPVVSIEFVKTTIKV